MLQFVVPTVVDSDGVNNEKSAPETILDHNKC